MMRALDQIIRLSADRLSPQRDHGRLGPRAQMAVIVSVLLLGLVLVLCWTAGMLYLAWRLIAWALA